MLKKLTSQNFESEINANTTLVDFYADWCGPCKMIAPIIEEIANERDDITVGKVNVDEEMELAVAYKVEVIPTLMVFKDGKLYKTARGAMDKEEILKMFE